VTFGCVGQIVPNPTPNRYYISVRPTSIPFPAYPSDAKLTLREAKLIQCGMLPLVCESAQNWPLCLRVNLILSCPAGVLFWFWCSLHEQASIQLSPASWQGHFLPLEQSLSLQYKWVRSRTSTGAGGFENMVGVMPPSSQALQPWPTGWVSSWFAIWLTPDPSLVLST